MVEEEETEARKGYNETDEWQENVIKEKRVKLHLCRSLVNR